MIPTSRVFERICSIAACAALFAVGAVNASNRTDEGHFYVCGPMDTMLAAGAKLATVTKGLPVTIEIQAGGVIGPNSFTLKGPSWKSSANLRIENHKFADGVASGITTLKNTSGSSLQGIRFDLISTTEEYSEKDANGKLITKTRSQPATCVPIFFGDLLDQESSDAVPIAAKGIQFNPETTKVTLNFVVSGMSYLGAFSDAEKDLPSEGIVFSPAGKLIVAGGQRARIFSYDPDGKTEKLSAKKWMIIGRTMLLPTATK